MPAPRFPVPAIPSLLIAALTVGIFVLDLVTPLGWADGFLYLVPLILLYRSPRQYLLVGFAALCSGLTVLGWILSPPVGAVGAATYNRSIGIALLWMTALFLRHRRRTEETLRHAQEMLENQVEERTAEFRKAIELLKNEIVERRQAEDMLKETLARHRAILESAMDAVITMTQEGRIVEFNPAAETMFGYTREKVIGKEMAELIVPPSLRERHRSGLARYLATGVASIIGRRIEIAAMHADSTEFPVELTVTKVEQGGKALFTAFIRDRTERKLAELALHDSEARFRLMINHANDAIFYLSLDGVVQWASRQATAIAGRPQAELVGRPITALLAPEAAALAERRLAAVRRGEAVSSLVELEFLRPDGSRLLTEANVASVLDETEVVGRLVVARDVTERRQAEDALRKSEQRLSQLLEDRERISRDLHDNIIQALYAIGLGLEESQRLLEEDSKTASANLDNAVKELNAVIRDVRSYIAWSEPKVADGRQLKAAIERLARTMEGTNLLHFRLKVDMAAADRLTPEEAGHVLYVAREAMSNSLRHSQARDGFVTLEVQEGNVRLVVADVGEGFDTAATERCGQGLRNMAARAQKLDARLRIISELGMGVRVMLDIPTVKKRASAGV